MKKIALSVIIICLILAGFFGGLIYDKVYGSPAIVGELINRTVNQPKDVDFSQFWQVWDLLHDDYVDQGKLTNKELLYGAIEGLVNAVGDPYTVFLRPKESQKFIQEISGSFSGIGIEIGLRNNVLTVISPIKNSPAEKAGLLAGDKIIKIGDKSTADMKLDEAVNLIRGPRGTFVRLTYLRNGAKDSREVTIIRDNIKIPTVAWKILDGNIAHVQLFIFNKNVDIEFDKVAKEIAKSKTEKIILDLRNNPGGLLDSAINITGYFTDPGQVVTIERFGDGKENTFRTQPNGILKNYPLVILLNKGSASASEILAGALKDNRNVTIIGETSYGKGSVQEVKDLPEGASVKITIAKWFTPNNQSISEQGIKPDIEVKKTEEDVNTNKDPQLDKALEVIKTK